jgi:catechol 2,3-dioxygenase-like lactoylglutathione lyase family enzyme
MERHSAVAIIPCNDLDESQAFYERLRFVATAIYEVEGYRILKDREGASVHLTRAVPGWVVAERNPFEIYVYSPDVEALAAEFQCKAEVKPWGLRAFAVSDPNGTLARIGWPLRPLSSDGGDSA